MIKLPQTHAKTRMQRQSKKRQCDEWLMCCHFCCVTPFLLYHLRLSSPINLQELHQVGATTYCGVLFGLDVCWAHAMISACVQLKLRVVQVIFGLNARSDVPKPMFTFVRMIYGWAQLATWAARARGEDFGCLSKQSLQIIKYGRAIVFSNRGVLVLFWVSCCFFSHIVRGACFTVHHPVSALSSSARGYIHSLALTPSVAGGWFRLLHCGSLRFACLQASPEGMGQSLTYSRTHDNFQSPCYFTSLIAQMLHCYTRPLSFLFLPLLPPLAVSTKASHLYSHRMLRQPVVSEWWGVAELHCCFSCDARRRHAIHSFSSMSITMHTQM